MPRLATITVHALAVAVLGVLAFKLLLESDRNGGAGSVRGEQIANGADGKTQGSSSGPDREGGGAAGGAAGGLAGSGNPGSLTFGSGALRSITTTGTTRNVLHDPSANQYGDALALIENKLR